VPHEAGLERRRAIDFACHEHGAVEQERGVSLLDDLEPRALECGAAGRGQLDGLEAGDRDAPTSPEGGVDEYGQVRSSELLRDSIPATWSQ
jgi:hypothetical protein